MTNYSMNADRNFAAGDRVIWNERDTGTVIKRADKDTLIIAWDNAQLGTTHAPSWSAKLALLETAHEYEENSRLLMGLFTEIPTLPNFGNDSCDAFMGDDTAPGYTGRF